MGYEEEKALESRYLIHTFARKPVELVRGHGMIVEDDKGREYLDFLAGIGVISLGHCHPKLVSALQDQTAKLMHVGNYYYIENRGEVAELLSSLLNQGIPVAEQTPWQSFFTNSGAESNECAIKLARLHARRQAGNGHVPRIIVTLDGSFHGRTLATLAATAQPAKQEAFQPLPDGFISTEPNNIEALEEIFKRYEGDICAVMVECIQGESGVHPLSTDFLKAARRLTEDCGASLICDEIQCGIFRCGAPFAFQRLGITPDIVTMAKGIAGGVPMGACAARSNVAAAFAPGDHGTTFGGSCLAIAGAKAALNTMVDEDYSGHVRQVGAYMCDKLSELPKVIEVRGLGLMIGAELAEGINAPDVVARGLEEGLLLNATGPSTLRFLPPLICTEEDVDALIERLRPLLS